VGDAGVTDVSIYDLPLRPWPAQPAAMVSGDDGPARYLVRPSHAMPFAPPRPGHSNVQPDARQILQDRLYDIYRHGYETFPLFVARLDEVTLYSPLMIAFQGDALVRETIPPWRRSHLRFYEALSTWQQCKDEVVVDEPVFLLANYSHTNYWHWVTQCLANLELARWMGLPDTVKFLVPGSAPGYVRQTLALMGVPPERLLTPGLTRVRLRRLLYPSLLEEHSNGRFTPLLLDTFSRLAAAADDAPATPTPRALYLTRQDSQARRIVNEDEWMNALESVGFACITCSQHSVADQIRLARGAQIIVSAHGAAMTNIGFAGSLCRVFELMPYRWGVSCFYSLTQMRRQAHFLYVEDGVSDPDAGHRMTMRVDVPKVMACLEAFRS
jgi:hypothetical protein